MAAPTDDCNRRRPRRRAALVVLALGLSLIGAACGTDAGVTADGSGTAAAPATVASDAGATDGALVDIGAGLQGVAGLTASTYATGLEHVAALTVDDQGRLWAATAAYQDTGTDRIFVVPSAGATPVEVITDVHTPLGLLWLDGELYVSQTERVVAYGGFDGSAFTTQRTVLELPEGSGESNGLALAADGRIWMGISAPCDACEPAIDVSGTVVSFGPDGSDPRIEVTGIRAAIGLAVHPDTGVLYASANHRDDLGADTPGDWLVTLASGQDWGFPDCWGQGGTACEGVPEPVAELDPHAALSGVAIVTGQLGPVVGDAAIVAEWATGKVQAVDLDAGATGTVSPFLTGVANPVAVALDPTGALVVGDWSSGTVYRIAPTS